MDVTQPELKLSALEQKNEPRNAKTSQNKTHER